METLLLCKEIEVFNPKLLSHKNWALVLFEITAQKSFVSRKLANELKLKETEEIVNFQSFGIKESKYYVISNVNISIKTMESDNITLEAYTLDYLTSELNYRALH